MKIKDLPEKFDISKVRIFIPKGLNVYKLKVGETAYIRGRTNECFFLSKKPGGKNGELFPILDAFFDINLLLNAKISFIPKKYNIIIK